MPRRDFVNMPNAPDTGNGDLNKTLSAMKENIELLCGLRGDVNNNAVIKGDVDIDYPDDPTAADLTNLTRLKETVRKLMVVLKT